MENSNNEKKFKIIDKRFQCSQNRQSNNADDLSEDKSAHDYSDKEKFIMLVSIISQNAFDLMQTYKEKEKNQSQLEEANMMISLLEALKRKTKNNLDNDEEDYLNKILHSLRLAYLDAIKFL